MNNIDSGHTNTLIVIVGPTAIGKTAVSIELAKHFKCSVISADSRQFYKEMNIGTAKPSIDEMQNVKHYFINSHSVTEEYNVGKYESDVLNAIDEIFKNSNCTILVGGSGLYIDAICKGLDNLPKANKEVREKINTIYISQGITGLQGELKKADYIYYSQVDLNNPQRIMRALEVCYITGKPYSTMRLGELKERPFNIVKIGLNIERELLYKKIDQRVDQMLAANLLEEVKNLHPFRHLNSLQTVGYKELFDYLDNKISIEKATELIKQNTRNYAKRQLTWFKKDKEIKWFQPDEQSSIIKYIETLLK